MFRGELPNVVHLVWRWWGAGGARRLGALERNIGRNVNVGVSSLEQAVDLLLERWVSSTSRPRCVLVVGHAIVEGFQVAGLQVHASLDPESEDENAY